MSNLDKIEASVTYIFDILISQISSKLEGGPIASEENYSKTLWKNSQQSIPDKTFFEYTSLKSSSGETEKKFLETWPSFEESEKEILEPLILAIIEFYEQNKDIDIVESSEISDYIYMMH